MIDFDKAALDRWITREPDWYEDEDVTASAACDYCGQDQCDCDRLQAEQEAEAQRMIY